MDCDTSILETIKHDDPMFIAAECFRDCLLGIGVDEDSAE